MNNPTTVDRRDVSRATNPLDSNKQIEQEDLGQPLDADADKLPAGGQGTAVRGVPKDAAPDDSVNDRYGGMPRGIPPARSGQSSTDEDEAEVRGEASNSGGTNRIDPDTRIPTPVKQDLGFRRTSEDGER